MTLMEGVGLLKLAINKALDGLGCSHSIEECYVVIHKGQLHPRKFKSWGEAVKHYDTISSSSRAMNASSIPLTRN